MERNLQIKKQIEYYLGDQNLKNDKFFYDLIISSPNRHIPVSVFLKCKKLDQIQAQEEEILLAVKDSQYLEVDFELKTIGRKVRELPRFKSKQFQLTFSDEVQQSEEKTKEGKELIVFKPYFIEISSEKHLNVNEKQLSKRMTKEIGVEIPVVILQRKKGVIIINYKDENFHQNKQKILDTPINAFGYQFQIKAIEDQQQQSLYEKYFNQITLALKTKYNASVCKKESNKVPLSYDEEFGPFEITGIQFNNIRQLKDKLKLIVQITPNNQEIKQEYKELVKYILQRHPDKEKINEICNIKVGVHPEYENSRCFFVENSDSKSHDISFHKCLNQLIEELKEKKKQ